MTILLLIYAIACLIQALSLWDRRDEFRTDIILLIGGSLSILLYLASHELLRRSIIMPLYGVWQAYGLVFFLFFGRAFFVPGVGALRKIYFSSVLFMIAPMLIYFGIGILLGLR